MIASLDARPPGDNGRGDEFGAARPRWGAVAATYARLFGLLAAEAAPAVAGADAWQCHLIWRVIDGQNPFSLRAAAAPYESLPESLVDQARRDLRGLQWLYSLDAETMRVAAVQVVGMEMGMVMVPEGLMGAKVVGG